MRHARPAALLALAASLAAPVCGAAVPPAAGAAPARIEVAVSIPAASRGDELQEAAVLDGIAVCAARAWPTLLEIRPGEAADASAVVTVSRDARAITVATELLPRSGARRTLRSTVPPESAGAVAAAAAADLAWLWAAATGFAGLAPGEAPPLTAVLETESLAGLTGWPPTGLEPLAIASSAEGLTILFPRGWLTLGPLFRIVRETARDLLLEDAHDGPVYAGIARARRGTLVLSRADGALELVDPLLGSRQPIDAPIGARLLAAAGYEAMLLAGSEAAFVPLEAAGAPRRSVRTGAAWVTAATVDAAADLWVWDGQERRIRVTSRNGREVSSIRPLVGAADLGAPQTLAVLADGSFLIGGSGGLWKFEASGIPAWRIARLPGVPGGPLPASFALAVDSTSDAVWLLDGPSGRLLQFGGTGRGIGDGAAAEAARALAALLQTLDERDAGSLERAGALALAADLPLAAARFATRLARAGSAAAEDLASAAELATLRDHARAASAAAAELADGLLAERALAGCQRAIDLARAWRDRDPGDPEAARLLEELQIRRRELRDATTPKPDAPTLAAAVRSVQAGDRRTLAAEIRVRAPADTDLAGLRVSFAVPGWTLLPAVADVGAVAAGAQRTLEVELALIGDAPWPPPAFLTAAAWVRWERGAEGRSAAATLSVPVESPPAEGVSR